MEDQATSRRVRVWTVPAKRPEIRLDAFVRECLAHLSRRQAEAAIHAGLFFFRGRVAKKGDRLQSGDELRFSGPELWLAERPVPKRDGSLDVVYEDAVMLAVNKPAGISTHGFSGRETDSVANRLVHRWPDLAAVGKSRWEPGIVHRLDRETSGLLLVAKTQHAFEHLRSQFHRRRVQKIYYALVWGETRKQGAIHFPLAHDRERKGRMRALTAPTRGLTRQWQAITVYRRKGKAAGVSLLEVDMKTGVTHQIRAHLAAVGAPIVGDRLYGEEHAPDFGLRRHFLHAWSLAVVHPDNEKKLTMVAKLPKELSDLLRRLKISV